MKAAVLKIGVLTALALLGLASAVGATRGTGDFAASLVVFVLGFLFLEIAQPIGGALFALAGVALALRLPVTSRQEAVGPAAPDIARSTAGGGGAASGSRA